ncbi:trans-sulfuration enzyme family protein [Thermaurantiacus sp.]
MKRSAGQDPTVTRTWRPATLAVRGGTARSEWGETSEALFLTSGYAYDSAGEAAARFRGEAPGMTYSRLQNPTVEMLEKRLALLEGAEAARATATGMAAMTAALMATLSAGDHLVAGRALFGSCRVLVDTILPRMGIRTTTVDARAPEAIEAAMRPETRAIFIETPANPTLDIVDIAETARIAHAGGALLIVDNAFATPALQKPLAHGADIVAYSATKLLDGQGRVLAGAICSGTRWHDEVLLPFVRHTGPNLSPFNAWVVLKALETLELRVARQSATALELARFLEGRVKTVYPFLPSHPGQALAARQMVAGGTILTIEPEGGERAAHALLDALRLIDISNNLGDSRTLMTHPATTTHHSVPAEVRAEMGIGPGLLRLSVGLEDPADLMADLDQALKAIGH